jgi:hypothetical protein
MDGDQQGLYLQRDGRTVASEAEIARDHDLVKRAHTLGVLHPAARNANEFQAALFVQEDGERTTRDSAARHTMDMTLRPGEALVWRWGRRHPLKIHGQPNGHRAPNTVANGRWEYRPDFAKEVWRKGADKAENVRATPEGLAADGAKAGVIEWTIKAPYVFVGGLLEVDGKGARFEASLDGRAWSPVQASLDSLFPESTQASYAWRLRCTLEADARLKKLAVLADLQMSPLALPEMAVGENTFTYTDATAGARSVQITHEWVERSTTKPPAAPAAAVAPKDGGESDGTQITFAWSAAKDPDGDKIADYHFQLSDRADFAYTLSSMMNRLVTRVGGKAEEKFALPAPGHLAPDRKYYWRVRAQDANGVWGPWSAAWSFTARGPAVPVDVKIEVDADRGEGLLRWSPNSSGTKPAKYRVHGSDEKGFSISDANFVAETTKPELLVLSRAGGSNRAHYRVVAVDGSGRRSADSDFAGAPRPFLFASPAKVKAGREFKLAVGAVRSLGDARVRDGNKLQMGTWEVEKPRFSLASAPPWLRIDPASGELSGTPPAAGRVTVGVTAVLEVEDRKLDIRSLVWGHDKVLETSTKTLGPARLDLAIEVEP